MAENFRRAVNAPHKAFGRARKKIATMRPVTKTGRVSRVAGITMTGMFQFLLWAVKYSILDNHLTRVMEKKMGNMTVGKNKKGGDKKISSFAKKYPNLSSHMLYYMMLGGVAIAMHGGHNGATESDLGADNNPDAINQELLRNMHTDFSTSQEALDAYWNEIAIGLTELETYRATPIVQRTETRATNGLGVTYHYRRNKNGEISRTDATLKTPKMSYDENYDQLRMHLEFETLKSLVNAKKKYPELTDKQMIGLALAGFQRPADISRIAAMLQKAKNPQQVADAFLAMGNITETYREGTIKRRWICGAYAAGIITCDDLLGMHRDAFSGVEVNNILRNDHFLLGGQTVRYVLGLKNDNSTVREFLKKFDAGRKILAADKENIHTLAVFDNAGNTSRAKKMAGTKTISFVNSSKKLRNNAHSADFNPGLGDRDGHDIA